MAGPLRPFLFSQGGSGGSGGGDEKDRLIARLVESYEELKGCYEQARKQAFKGDGLDFDLDRYDHRSSHKKKAKKKAEPLIDRRVAEIHTILSKQFERTKIDNQPVLF